jgi:hypothetical protein
MLCLVEILFLSKYSPDTCVFVKFVLWDCFSPPDVSFSKFKICSGNPVFKFGREVFIQALFSSFECCADGFVDAKNEIGIVFILAKTFSGKSFQMLSDRIESDLVTHITILIKLQKCYFGICTNLHTGVTFRGGKEHF